MFKNINLKIGPRLIISFLIVAVMVGIVAFYVYRATSKPTLAHRTLEDIKFSFEGQKSGLIGFMSGNESSLNLITESNNFIQNNLDELIVSFQGKKRDYLYRLKEISTSTYNKKINTEDSDSIINLLEKQDQAFGEFLDKNNKHLIRLSEYKKYWGNTKINDKLTKILIGINNERTIVLDFNPNKENWEEVRTKFRAQNDEVVSELVSFLVNEIDVHINAIGSKAHLQSVKNSLIVQRNIAAKITAETFPAVSEKGASLAGIVAGFEARSLDAEKRTIDLGQACEKQIINLEEAGVMITDRYNVQTVGENQNSIQVLISLIKCQQGLGVNVEDFMKSKLAIKDELYNFYMPNHDEFNRIINELIKSVDATHRTTLVFWPSFGVLIIIIIIFGIFISRSISKPINILINATRDIANGNLSKRVKVDSKNEIGELSNSFNIMIEQIEEIDKNKTEFISLASHQLRTPVSTVNWYSETLLSGDLGNLEKKQHEYVEKIYKNNRRMGKLVNALLDTSRIELGTFKPNFVMVDLNKVVSNVLDEYSLKLKEKNIKVTVKIEDAIKNIFTEATILRTIVENFISNSIKYNKTGGIINLKIRKDENNLILQVSDHGYGIPKIEQIRIFTKLYRASNVRDLDTDGTGLGLYIVKAMVERMGGKIWFKSTENEGSMFSVLLPINNKKNEKNFNYRR